MPELPPPTPTLPLTPDYIKAHAELLLLILRSSLFKHLPLNHCFNASICNLRMVEEKYPLGLKSEMFIIENILTYC